MTHNNNPATSEEDVVVLKNYESLPKFVINIDDTDLFYSQGGETFTKVPVFDYNEHSLEKLTERFDYKQSTQAYSVVLTKAQVAQSISHYNVYQRIVDNANIKDDQFVLVAQEDVFFVENFAEKMDQLLTEINKECYEDIELVLLANPTMDKQVDYAYDLSILSDKKTAWTDEDSTSVGAEKLEVLKTLGKLGKKVQVKNRNIVQFEYTGRAAKSNNYMLYGSTQNLFVPTCYTPCGCSLYLVRKSALVKALKKFPSPFWLADDFRKFIAPAHTFFASPVLALTDGGPIGEATDEDKLNKLFFRKFTPSEQYLFKLTSLCPISVNWLFSSNSRKRRISRFMRKITGQY